VKVALKSDTPMKGLRFTLILQNLKLNAVIYKSVPDVESLERGIDQNFINFILITQISDDEIYKLIMVDMVEYIDISLRNVQAPDFFTHDKTEKITQEAKRERTAVQEKESDKALTKEYQSFF
jgi:hypothetical protein